MREYIDKVSAMLNNAGLYRAKLSTVFEESVKNKEELNTTLGLNEQNHFRKELQLPLSDEDFAAMYPNAAGIFKGIPGWTGTWSPTSGKITVGKDKVNITKFLAKQLADNKVPLEYVNYLYGMLKIDPANPKAESQIVPKFGEIINKKTTNVVVISTNPFDFFTCSAQEYKYAAFKSCYRPNGEYFNGCISLARDNFSTISYKASTERIDYKMGRAWMFILGEIIAQTKTYGTFTTNERKIAREYAEHCLSAKFGFEPKTYKRHFVEKWKGAVNSGVLYFDDYAIDLGYPSAKFDNFTDKLVPKLKFSDALCLKCGRETRYPQKGICGVCSGSWYPCKTCGQELHNSINYHSIEGNYHCDDCAKEKFVYCEVCNKFHTKGTGIKVSDGKLACPTCINKHYYKCDFCGEYHSRANNPKVSIIDTNQAWCSVCFKANGFMCHDCGGGYSNADIHEVNTLEKGVVKVCSTCIPAYATCQACNHAFKGGYHTEDGDVCVVCYENYDYCLHCDSLVLKADMVFDGEKICCKNCVTDTKATNDSYLAEVASIIAAVEELRDSTKDTAMEALKKITEDRVANGYQIGDVVTVTCDTVWHGYKTGDILTVCGVVKNKEGQNVYLTFRDNLEWYIPGSDITFARPAVIVGELINTQHGVLEVLTINTNKDGAIIFTTPKGDIPTTGVTYSGIIDAKAFNAPIVNYKIGELIQITANSSKHPYKIGDKVKVTRIDTSYGFTRFFVKKGAKLGCIYGVGIDTIKAPKVAPAPKSLAAEKVALFKEKTAKVKRTFSLNDVSF